MQEKVVAMKGEIERMNFKADQCGKIVQRGLFVSLFVSYYLQVCAELSKFTKCGENVDVL